MTAQRTTQPKRLFRPTACALAVALAYSSAQANPTAPSIVKGNVSMSTQGKTLTITNTPGAIINWQSFSIGAGEITRFIQQSASSQVLNRVVGVDPSVILGALQSNGRVFLINPNGIAFGPGAQVNVAGLVASTLNLSNENFAAGRLKFDPVAGAGKIKNEGSITTATGGQVILVAPQIENSGIIRAPDGEIYLAAGRSANLVDLKNPDISVEINAPADKVLNVGQLIAKNISVYGALVENSGTISANTVVVGESGRVSLRAKQNVTTAATSRITAEGPTAGAITVQAEHGIASLAGAISVESTAAVGGSVEVLAPKVTIANATISASGETGGGRVSIGVRPATVVTAVSDISQALQIARTARITANAKKSGKGGSVVIRSRSDTRVAGTVEVRGSRDSGSPFKSGVTPFLLTRRPGEPSATSDGGNVQIQTDAGLLLVDGVIDASALAGMGGRIELSADVLMQLGMVQAMGSNGGAVTMSARNVMTAAPVNVSGTIGRGGEINVQATGAVMQTSAAQFSADGADGGHIRVQAGERIFSSAGLSAVGVSGTGGAIEMLANEIVLRGATLDASGETGGGTILVGGDFQGRNPDIVNAIRTAINFSTTLNADAKNTGDGGKVIVWANDRTDFYGTVSARGGTQSGNGGFIEVSGKDTLHFGGVAEAGAPNGRAGTLLLDPKNIIIDAAAGGPAAIDLVDPHIGAGDQFGYAAVVLTNGNVVAPDPNDDFVASNAGAVYLFNGSTGALISTLTGSRAGDRIGSGGSDGIAVFALPSGNYVVVSPTWNNGAATSAGAATWASGVTGINGVVSAANSLVGTSSNDQVGSGRPSSPGADAGPGVVVLTNGNYVVQSPLWNNGTATEAGAVTWASGTSATTGAVSASNSLVGTLAFDQVGFGDVTPLTNGNYVVRSIWWGNDLGAATFGSGTSGISGAVSALNSLVGTRPSGSGIGDNIGFGGITALTNGNYVVNSPRWNRDAGAATWGSGTTGIVGAVSTLNSLYGTGISSVSSRGTVALANGNYVVLSPNAGTGGAVTWGSGTTGTTGLVSAANSLVGSDTTDSSGSGGATALPNGNYVVSSPSWGRSIGALSAGAVTWADGAGPTVATVSAANSLVGSAPNDFVGNFGTTVLANGNYVVSSPWWANGAAARAGAVTWARGDTAITGVVSAANSLVGTTIDDRVGYGDAGQRGGITLLSNGNYVVLSSNWNNGAVTQAGAVTWGNGTSGIVGAVSAANSLVGTTIGDQVGGGRVTALHNSNYVVRSYLWNNGSATQAGAVTWADGTTGIAGAVGSANSLVGTTSSDQVGGGGITALLNGNYVASSPNWSNGAAANVGAVTWSSGTAGRVGPVAATNSLIGVTAGDRVGGTSTNPALLDVFPSRLRAVTEISGNSVLVRSSFYDNGAVDTGRLQIFNGSLSGGGGSFNNPLLFSDNAAGTSTITPSAITTITNAGTAVVLQANNDITLAASSPIATSAAGAGGNITMRAGRSIALNSNITTDNGSLTLVANDLTANGVVTAERDAGAATISVANGVTLNTGSALLSLDMQPGTGRTGAQAQAGNIAIGNGATLRGGQVAVANNAGSNIIMGTASLQATATGLANATNAIDVRAPGAGSVISSNATMTTTSGGVRIIANGFVELDPASVGSVINAAGDVNITSTTSSISAQGPTPSSAFMEVRGSSVTLDAGTFVDIGEVTGHGLRATSGDMVITARTESFGGGAPGSQKGPLLADNGNIFIRVMGTGVNAFVDFGDAISTPNRNITIDNGAGGRIARSINLAGSAPIVAGNSSTGNITLRATGFINVGTSMSAGNSITLDSGNVVSTAGGAVLTTDSLITRSVGGLSLTGANVVNTLNATNTGGGDIQFTHAAGGTLGVSDVSQTGVGNVVLTADDIEITGAIAAGANTVTLRPTTLARNITIGAPVAGTLSLVSSELNQVTAGVLEVGRADGTGNISQNAGMTGNDITAGTLRFVTGGNIALTGGLGLTGTEFNNNFEARAGGNLSVTNTLLFANGTGVALIADNDANGVGNLLLTNSTGGPKTILAGTSSANTAPMTLQGALITIGGTNGMAVSLRGTGTQTVTTGGALLLQGGSVANAQALLTAPEGVQNVTASGIQVLAGSGTNNNAEIVAGASQTITVGADGIGMVGGTAGSGNFANFRQTGATSDQTITVNAGGNVTLVGGGGTNNGVNIQNLGRAQSLSFTAGGNLNLQAGSGPSGNNADFFNGGAGATQQTITGATAINVTGGTVGQSNDAGISALTGNQAIIGTPDITLTGGASGGSVLGGNEAFISLDGGNGIQTIGARNILIRGGAGGSNNSASIDTNFSGTGNITSTIATTGTLTIEGAAAADSATGIGGANGVVNFTINSVGAISVTGGTGPGSPAGIGNFGNFNSNITINAQAGVTLNGGGPTGAQIGSSTAGGTVIVNAGLGGAGSIALNAGRVLTTGNATLAATSTGGQITQTAGGVVATGTLTARAHSGIALTAGNSAATLTASNSTANGIQYTQADGNPFTLAGISQSGGAITIAAGGMSVTGAVNSGGSAIGLQARQNAGITIGSSANLNAGGGTLTFAAPVDTVLAGTITNSTVTTSGAGQLAPTSGTLDAVTLDTNVRLANPSSLIINNGLTFANGRAITLASTGGTLSRIFFEGSAQTVSGNGEIVFGGSSNTNAVFATSPLTIGSGVTFRTTTGSGSIFLGAPLTNQGTISAEAGHSINIDVNTGTPSLTNTGTLRASGAGSVLTASVLPTNAGLIEVTGNATFSTNNNPLTNNGTIQGTGTINLGAGNALTNNAVIRAGTSPGTLNVTGDLVLAGTSITQVEIQSPGTSGGTDYDVINVSGQVRGAAAAPANWGVLDVVHLGGFTPSGGSNFTILNYASHSGDFTTKNFPNGFSYTATPNATNYVLAFGAGGTTNTWIATTGLWETAANWSLGHVPTASEDAVIPDVGLAGVSDTIAVSAAAQTARRVTAAEHLSIAGGALTLGAGSSSVNAGLTISGGTLTANGALAANTLNMSGNGTLAGLGTVTISGATTIASGAPQLNAALSTNALSLDAATLTIGSSGILTLTGANSTINAANIVNGGIYRTAGTGNLLMNNGSTFNNTGTFDFQSDVGIEQNDARGGNSTFTNNGVLRKSAGTGTSTIGISSTAINFTGSGVQDAQTGTIAYGATNTFTNGATFTGGGINAITTGAAMTGTVTSSSNLELRSGGFGGGATLAGITTWTGGAITGPLTVGTGATLNVAGSGPKVVDAGGVLTNAGTIAVTGAGNLLLNNGGHLVNNATFDFRTDAGIEQNDARGGVARFDNVGAVTKTGGTGASRIGISSAFTFTNSGTLSPQTGAIHYAANNTFNGGTLFTGTGGNFVVSDTTFNGTVTSNNLTLQSGNFGGGGTLAGTTEWTGGAITGALTVGTGATLNVAGVGPKVVDSAAGALTNNGTVAITGTGNLVLNNGSRFTNNALFDFRTDAGIEQNDARGGIATYVNPGTLRKSAGTQTSTVGLSSGFAFANSGRLEAETGTINYAASNTFSDGTLFTGAASNVITSNTTFTGTVTSNNLTLQSGNFGGGGTLAGTTSWIGGTVTGALNVGAGATLDLAGGNGKAVDGAGVLTNNGTIALTGTGNLVVNNSGHVVNNTLFDFRSSAGIEQNDARGGVATFTNVGTLRKSAGTASTVGMSSAFNFVNTGTLDAQTSRINYNAVNAFNNGTTFTGAGLNVVTNGATFTGTVTSSNNLVLESGNYGGTGALAGTTTWTGGTVSGTTLRVASGATMLLADGGAKVVDGSGGVFTNDGTVAITGTNNLVLNNSGRFVNNGTFDIRTDAGIEQNDARGGIASFANAGTLIKSAGLGTSTIGQSSAFTFTNTGTMRVASGTLQTSSGTFATNAGTIDLASGTVFSTAGSNLTNTGTITGNGTIALGAATLTNSGRIRPGTSPGTLTVSGNLALTSSSIIDVEIQPPGTTAGTDYDRINVSGSAALDGTLNVTHLGGFAPSGGATSTPITYASRTGDFATINAPSGFSYGGTPNATNYVLTVGGVSSTNTWIATSGLWQIAANWSLGHVPTASEDAVIPDVGVAGVSDTITVSAAAQTARRVTAAENLTISSGALTLGSGNSATNGALTVSGGTLSAAGPLAASRLTVSGGTINANGAFTVSGPFNWSGGDITGAGALTTTGTTTISSTGQFDVALIGKTWNNSGTVNIANGSVFVGSDGTTDGTLNNVSGGIINLAGNGSFTGNSGSNVVNAGTLNKTGNGALNINNDFRTSAFGFANASGGRVNIATGTLVMDTEGVDAGTYNVASGATVEFSRNRTFNSGTSFTGGGSVLFSFGTHTFGAAQTFAATGPAVSFTFGTLTSASPLTIASPFNWSRGDIAGAGVLTTTGTTTIGSTGPFDVALTGKTWNNSGTVNITDRSLFVGATSTSGSTFNNVSGGTVNLAGNGSFTGNSGSNVTNAGTLNKTGNGLLNINNDGRLNAFAFDNTNAGIVNVSAGTLVMNTTTSQNGTFNIASGATLSTAGANLLNGATGIITGSGTLNLGTGTLTNNGTLRPGGPSANSYGTLSITGNVDLAASSVVEIEAQAPGTTAGVHYDVINVTGRVRAVTGNNWGTLNVLHSAGTAPPQNASLVIMNYDPSSSGDFATKNFPTGFTYTATPGQRTYDLIAGISNTSTNTWIATSGLWQTAANWSLGHVPTATEDAVIPDVGAPGVSDTVTVSSTGQAARRLTSAENLVVSSGALTLGTGNSAVNAGLTVSGGNLTANGTLSANSLTVSNGAAQFNGATTIANALNLSGGALTGSGLVTVNGTGSAWTGGRLAADLTIPTGSLAITGGGSAPMELGGTTLTTGGIVTWSGGTLVALGIGPGTFNNNGVFDLQGTLAMSGNTSALLSNGMTLNNAGLIRRSTGVGAADLSRVRLSGAGAVDVQQGTLGFGIYPVVLGGAVTVANGATLDLSTGGTVNGSVSGAGNLLAGGITGNGAITTTGTLVINGGGAATFNSTTPLTPSSVTVSSGSAIFNSPLASTGALSVAGSGITRFNANATFGGALSNTGRVSVDGGTLTVGAGSSNAGSLNVATGATFSTGGTAFTNAITGTLSGTGTYNFGGATLTNAGTIGPGNSPGTMTIVGNLVMTPSSTFLVELAGATAGLFDVLNVSGTATLGGALNVQLINGFAPGADASLPFFNYGSSAGSFSSMSLPAGFNVSFGPTGLDALFTAPPAIVLPPAVTFESTILSDMRNDIVRTTTTTTTASNPSQTVEASPAALILQLLKTDEPIFFETTAQPPRASSGPTKTVCR